MCTLGKIALKIIPGLKNTNHLWKWKEKKMANHDSDHDDNVIGYAGKCI